ncbi:MAG: hypothetical protein AAGI01_01935 [Myxococcota bacterium]
MSTHCWTTRASAALFALALALASSCECSCSKKRPDAPGDQASTAAKEVDPFDRVDARTGAIIRAQSLESADAHIRTFLERSDAHATGASRTTFSFDRVLSATLGRDVVDELRKLGNIELLYAVPETPEGAGDWTMVVPVEDVSAFLSARNPKESPTEVGVVQWSGPRGPLYASKEPVVLDGELTTDDGALVAVSTYALGAQYAQAVLRAHVRRQNNEFFVHLWPRRMRVHERYARQASLLRQMLSARGHNLLPARASIVHVQANLIAALGDPEHWPEPLVFTATSKIRTKKDTQVPYVKAIRAFLEVPIEGNATLETLHVALRPRKSGSPPPLQPGAAMIRTRLERDELEEVVEALLPRPIRMLIASRGEDAMTILHNTFLDLLEHNRGPTTVAFYEGRLPLAGEVYLAWQTMDIERLQKSASTFHSSLLENFWMPLHLADPATRTTEPMDREGFVGGSETFEIPAGPGKTARIGACWGVKDLYYYAYYGEDPCARLVEYWRPLNDQIPSEISVDAELATVIDTLYMPPNTRLKRELNEQRIDFGISATQDGFLEVNMLFKKPDALLAVLASFDELASSWQGSKEFDVSTIVSEFTGERAI